MLPVHTIESEFLTNQEKLRPVLLLVLGLCFGFVFWAQKGLPPGRLCLWIYKFFNQRQFYDKIMNDLVSYPLFRFGVTTSLIDKGLIEVLVPVGCTNRAKNNNDPTRPLVNCLYLVVVVKQKQINSQIGHMGSVALPFYCRKALPSFGAILFLGVRF